MRSSFWFVWIFGIFSAISNLIDSGDRKVSMRYGMPCAISVLYMFGSLCKIHSNWLWSFLGRRHKQFVRSLATSASLWEPLWTSHSLPSAWTGDPSYHCMHACAFHFFQHHLAIFAFIEFCHQFLPSHSKCVISFPRKCWCSVATRGWGAQASGSRGSCWRWRRGEARRRPNNFYRCNMCGL